MTDEEKDVWVLRVQALGNMGIATVLACMLAFNSYIESGFRQQGLEQLNHSYEVGNALIATRNESIHEMVKVQERAEQQMDRLILVLDSRE